MSPSYFESNQRLSVFSQVAKRFSASDSILTQFRSGVVQTVRKARSLYVDTKNTNPKRLQKYPQLSKRSRTKNIEKRDISKPIYIPRPTSWYGASDAFVRARSDSLISASETEVSLEVVYASPISISFSDSASSYSSVAPDLVFTSPTDTPSMDSDSIITTSEDEDTLYEGPDEQSPFHWDDVLDCYENLPTMLPSLGTANEIEC